MLNVVYDSIVHDKNYVLSQDVAKDKKPFTKWHKVQGFGAVVKMKAKKKKFVKIAKHLTVHMLTNKKT